MTLPTGPTIILEELPPRSWSNVTVPEIPEGVDQMPFYAEWLTDYLTKNPLPPSENQREYVDCLPTDFLSFMAEHHPEGLAHLIAECQGPLEIIEASY
jgi:hypothetical protein